MKMKSLPWLEQIFAEVFQQWQSPAPEIHARYFPFAGLQHTIRRRKGRIYVRLSEVMLDAPYATHQAVAHLLVARLLKQPSPAHYEKLYQRYAATPKVERAAAEAQRRHGHRQPLLTTGKVYDLDAIFTKLNRSYFGNDLARPSLRWSKHATLSELGHHDEVRNTIVISRTLDDASMPPYVIEFVVYHEMLHLKHPSQLVNGRRRYHSAAFRAEESRFEQYNEALNWIEAWERQQAGKNSSS
jgi:predicted metal-dependent hydrolase